LRIVFMGTPAFAVPTLEALIAKGHCIPAVYTRPPKPAGRRGREIIPSPIHEAARLHKIQAVTPASLRPAAEAAHLKSFAPDAVVVAAYGLILPKAILEIPAKGCLNLHASLLPRWRGAAPVQRAIMAGDKETGVMVMHMEEGLDEGPVAPSKKITIGADANAGQIASQLAHIGAGLMVQALSSLEKGELDLSPQPTEGVTYAPKIDKAELRIDWRRPAAEVHNHVRALSPAPGAYFEADLGKRFERIRVLRTEISPREGVPGLILDDRLTIACGEGAVRILEAQRPGKRPMKTADFLHGLRMGKGMSLAATKDAAV
jgi:methionyl-tRNA formyltransferase